MPAVVGIQRSRRQGAVDVAETNLKPPAGIARAEQVLQAGDVTTLDLLLALTRRSRSIFRFCLVMVLLGVGISLLMHNVYTGETVILTPQKSPSVSAVMGGDLGLLTGLTSPSDALGLTDPNDIYITMLTSRTVEEKLIQQFGMADVYKTKTRADALKQFDSNLKVTSGHDGTIKIAFTDQSPDRAAAVANAVVTQFSDLTRDMAVSEAAQRRAFFSDQFQKSKQALADAEVAMRQTQEKSGVLDLDKQAAAVVASIADLEGQIAAQQIQIRGMETFSTARNPDLIRAREQLRAMQAQLSQMQHRKSGGEGDIYVSTQKLPAAGLEYVRRLRDVKYYEAIYEALGRQYEAAVVDEGSHGDVVQVVDTAVPPDKKSGPKRSLIVLAFLAVALFLSCGWAVASELFARIKADPVSEVKLQEMAHSLRWATRWLSLLPQRSRGLWRRVS